MLSVEILEALSGCKVTRPPKVAANANAAMNAAEAPPPLMAEEKIMRGVVSFLDFKGVEAFAQLCKFRAADGAPVPGYDRTLYYAQVALQDVELVVTCKDAGGRPCKLPMVCMSFIENSVDRREKCCIETIINSFDINVCSVAMRIHGDGDHEYVVSDEDAAAIKSKTMWLRSSYYRQPDQARVEKYRSRGFTLVADPAIP